MLTNYLIKMHKMKNFLSFILIAFVITTGQYIYGQKKDPSLAPTPPMGWNSWNYFGKDDINEEIVYEVIDAIIEHGLKDAGYNYVVIDGGWRDVKLSPEGKLLPHPVKFPNGIKPLVDYAHERGLKFGLHTVPGTHDCGGDEVGGYNREELHVQQFVEWGLDFVKLDLCRHENLDCGSAAITHAGWCEEPIEEVYEKWSELLYNSGREIILSISAYRFRDWNPDVSHMSRTTFDIQSKRQVEGAVFNSESRENRGFLTVMACAEINNRYADFAGNGYWNDPDMLVTGDQGLSVREQESHFALWSIITAPLMLGNDPRNMDDSEKKLILNREIIAINQDPGEQGILYKNVDNAQIWKKRLSNGDLALLLLNLDPEESKEVKVDFKEFDLPQKLNIRDVINHKNLKYRNNEFSRLLEPHACKFILVSGKR